MTPQTETRNSDIGIPYRLVRGARSSIGLVITTHGLEIRAPKRTPLYEIEAAITERRLWIARAIQKQQTRLAQVSAMHDGGFFLFKGQKLPIILRPSAFEHLELTETQCLVNTPRNTLNPMLFESALLQAAGRTLPALAQIQAAQEKLPLKDVRISKARTMWGSCTADGRVRLNYRLMQLPPALCHHVVAHELAHLVEFNHSPRFWAIVHRLDPNSHAHRRAINQYSVLLER
jgi:predicted metal-dependent hydrolase